MLLRKNTKRHILRVVCMIMLMLIHFDAYGYELAAVFQEVNAEHVLPVSEAETQIVQGNDVEIEWADLCRICTYFGRRRGADSAKTEAHVGVLSS